jgi:hypothetical protein
MGHSLIMKSVFFFGTGLALCLLGLGQWERSANAHAILEYPAPRPSSNPGNTTGPCGPYAVASPTVLQAGSTITLTWEETIHHAGNFQFYFAPSTVTSQQTILPLGLPSPTPSILPLYAVAQTFANSDNLPHQYSASVKLPETPCANCTLQMYQVNSDGVGGATYPAPSAGVVYYSSCADIELTAGPVPSGTPSAIPSAVPSATPAPTPAPTPSNCTTLAPTWTNVNATIIQPLCISCHMSATVANGNTSFATYAQTLQSVDVTDPTQSLMYQLTEEGPSGGGMPVTAPGLTTAQESLMLQWIQSGAPNN